MQKTVLIFLFSVLFFPTFPQSPDNFLQLGTVGFSFSSVTVQPTDSSAYSTVSYGLSTSILKGNFMYQRFEGTAGFGLHWVSTKIKSDWTNLKVSYMGFAPDLRVKYYLNEPESVGACLGIGSQFFVLPLASAEGIKVTSLRPMFLFGLRTFSSEDKVFGGTIFFAPSFVTGSRSGIDLKKTWFLGMEIDFVPGLIKL
jgi:hypothetical protein